MPSKNKDGIRKLCVVCNRSHISRPRGMCWRCYYNPEVKRVMSTSKHARRGVCLGNELLPLPSEPTSAEPGSEEKIMEFCNRASGGFRLHHPDDKKHRFSPDRENQGIHYLILGAGEHALSARIRRDRGDNE